jgi:hypothetical protein
MSSAQQVWELSRAALADQDGWIAVFRVYIDESGIHDGSPVLTVGAYLARPKVWRNWTKKWNAAKRPIKVYHAADAANLEGEFEDWSKEQVGQLAAKLLPIIANDELAGMVIGINLDQFRDAVVGQPRLSVLLGNPYTSCFHWLVTTIIQISNEYNSKEKIAFIHETNSYKGDALSAFSWIKENKNLDGRLISLTFGSKDDYPPLQAADILAYEGNKRFRDPSRAPRRAWNALNPESQILEAHFGAHNIGRLIADLSVIDQTLLADGWDGRPLR